MARTPRRIERVQFGSDSPGEVVSRMARLSAAGDGWVNLVPKVGDNDERSTSLGFFTLLSGGGAPVTMCTWVPAGGDGRRAARASLGITHLSGGRALAQLQAAGVPVPAGWLVEQDHPRRGLVVRPPGDAAEGEVLAWALHAVAALAAPDHISGWSAEVHCAQPS